MAEALSAAFIAACEAELRALKPGNVHVHAAGHDMTVADFEISARVAAAPLCRPGTSVGARIHDAVAATRDAVGCNTNLGIVLLAAPLLAAAERATASRFRVALHQVLAELTLADAVACYAAIRLAAPGGLGRAETQDAASEPTVTLRDAMALAAGRDRIARQYVTDYDDVFAIGIPALAASDRAGIAAERATSRLYLRFLAAFPDSHVGRKHGMVVAERVRGEAAKLAALLDDDAAPALLAFDAALKQRGINPGTAADLTVTSLLSRAVEHIVNR